MSKTTIAFEGKGKDQIPIITGECPKCHRGENSLIIIQRQKSVNHRERDNDKLTLRCLCCKLNYRTDLYTLIKNKEEN